MPCELKFKVTYKGSKKLKAHVCHFENLKNAISYINGQVFLNKRGYNDFPVQNKQFKVEQLLEPRKSPKWEEVII